MLILTINSIKLKSTNIQTICILNVILIFSGLILSIMFSYM